MFVYVYVCANLSLVIGDSEEPPLRVLAAIESLGALRLPEATVDGRTFTVSRHQALCALVYLPESDPRLRRLKASFGNGSPWIAVRIGSMTTSLREFQALHCLQHSRFAKAIMNPAQSIDR